MPLTDLSLAELETYRSPAIEPRDFDEFWTRTLAEQSVHAGAPARFEPIDSPLRTVEVQDVTFAGFGGTPVRGWFLRPRNVEGPLPCVVELPGYGGGRGLPHESLLYSAAGYAHLVMDVRGQGAHWLAGDTPDPQSVGAPRYPGFMTDGIADPDDYYFRRLIVDAVHAVQVAAVHPSVDPDRVCVMGGSAGAFLALATTALGARVRGVICDVPFLCDVRRGCDIATDGPYLEVAGLLRTRRDLVSRAFATLGYFDGVSFARRATAPALFSAALMDPICPPSTVFAAVHEYAGPVEMTTWPFNRHEGGEGYQQLRRLAFLDQQLAAS